MPSQPKLKQNSSSSDRIGALTYLAFGLFAVLVIFLGISKITGDDDIFWHLATGKWIVENRMIPTHDVFGLISGQQTWIPFEWGWDVVTYTLYSIAGQPDGVLAGNLHGIQLLPVLIYLVIFTLLVLIMRRLKITPSLILLILLLTLIVSLDRLTPRPHVVSLLGITLIIYLYTNSRYSVPRTLKRLWWLPVIFCLWTNAHPGVLTGFLLLFILYLSEIVFFLTQRGRTTRKIRTEALAGNPSSSLNSRYSDYQQRALSCKSRAVRSMV